MKLGMLAAAAISVVGVTGASTQVLVAEPYAETYVAAPVYAAPAPVYVAPAPGPVIVGEPVYVAPPAIGGYVPPRYSYTITSPRRGVINAGSRDIGGCAIGPDGYCY
jgi:hypothetical protein